MGGDANPDANVSLSLEEHEHITRLPDVQILSEESDAAALVVKQKHGSIQKAIESVTFGRDAVCQDYKRKQRKLRAKKEFYRSQMKARLREEYFQEKDVMLIKAQLNSDAKLPISKAGAAWIPSMPERAELASLDNSVDMRSPDMRDSRIAAIQALTSLCGRVEPSRQPVTTPTVAPSRKAEVTARDLFPMRSDKLQCLFCIGDTNLVSDECLRSFRRPQALWTHARTHLERFTGTEIPCPHPKCTAQAVTLKSVEHPLNHAQREHDIRMRSR